MMDAVNTEATPALLFLLQRLHPDNQFPRHGGAEKTIKMVGRNWESSFLSKNANPPLL
jgi:hypothetical protein